MAKRKSVADDESEDLEEKVEPVKPKTGVDKFKEWLTVNARDQDGKWDDIVKKLDECLEES